MRLALCRGLHIPYRLTATLCDVHAQGSAGGVQLPAVRVVTPVVAALPMETRAGIGRMGAAHVPRAGDVKVLLPPPVPSSPSYPRSQHIPAPGGIPFAAPSHPQTPCLYLAYVLPVTERNPSHCRRSYTLVKSNQHIHCKETVMELCCLSAQRALRMGR